MKFEEMLEGYLPGKEDIARKKEPLVLEKKVNMKQHQDDVVSYTSGGVKHTPFKGLAKFTDVRR